MRCALVSDGARARLEGAVGEGQGGRITGFARPDAAPLGLAVDLGTTNAAGFIVDLAQQRRLASLGLENPQASWGADLVSRLTQAARENARAVRGSITAAA